MMTVIYFTESFMAFFLKPIQYFFPSIMNRSSMSLIVQKTLYVAFNDIMYAHTDKHFFYLFGYR